MSTEPGPPTESQPSLPGMSVEDYALAVNAFAQLQNEGALTSLLGRENTVRIIGEVSDFANRLKKSLPATDFAAAKAALEEIRLVIQGFFVFKSAASAAEALTDHFYGHSPHAPGRVMCIDRYRKKVDLSERLIHPGLKTRSNRLASTLGAVLEDVDMEVIAQRQSPLEDRIVRTPFLRLGIRYSKPGHPETFPFFFSPFTESRSSGKQFEIECDLADIDLFIARLFKAKELLLKATPLKESEGSLPENLVSDK